MLLAGTAEFVGPFVRNSNKSSKHYFTPNQHTNNIEYSYFRFKNNYQLLLNKGNVTFCNEFGRLKAGTKVIDTFI